ncbi:aryl-sulfate sulfotransferase [Streptococcus hyovaginalis]|uniref:aryl-sulfate sulfotransferase n=1 Tax=Streptococcus hyovaginalis TaxID=149015 RepID=UPI003B3B1C9F
MEVQEGDQQLEEVSSGDEATPKHWQVSALTSQKGDGVHVLDYRDLDLKSIEDVFDIDHQEAIHKKLQQLRRKKSYSFDNMLLVSNPYLTNTTGLYLAFDTEEPVKVSYQIDTLGYPSYHNTLYNPEGIYARSHDYQLIGSIAGLVNTITVTAETASGDQVTKQFTYTPPMMQSSPILTYMIQEGSSKAKLSNGLFAIIGNKLDLRATYLVDNRGVVRAEMPIIDYYATRLNQTPSGELIMGISSTALGAYSRLGQVTTIYDVGKEGYELHHDNIVTNDETAIYALATSSEDKKTKKLVEDRILKLNKETGAIEAVIDFSQLLADYYQVADGIEETNAYASFWDPIHLNSVQDIGNDAIIVSSRETSTIIKIVGVSQNPQIDYLISDPSIWEGISDYSDLVLDKVGDFIPQTGQHTVTYVPDPNLEDGQYYLYMFNNNSTVMDSRKDFDWRHYQSNDDSLDVNHSVSFYYKYFVDENKRTFERVDAFEVPYSPYLSSTQAFGDNMLVASGQDLSFGEYDTKGNLIKRFRYLGETTSIYRVFKYDFDNFYFTQSENE